jgi:hypothetical protein
MFLLPDPNEPPHVQPASQEVQATPPPVPSPSPRVSTGNRKVLIAGIASFCAAAIVVVGLGFFLGWFGGAPELSQDVLNPEAGPPTAQAGELLDKLERIAKIADDPATMRRKINELTWKIHAAFGDTANAIVARQANDDTGKLEVLMYVLESARRRADTSVTAKAADNIYALALKMRDDPNAKLKRDAKARFILAAMWGYAAAGNFDRFEEVLTQTSSGGDEPIQRSRFLAKIVSRLRELDDLSGAMKVLEHMSANERIGAMAGIAKALAARSDKTASAKCYRACLKDLVAVGKTDATARALRDCLKGMCETGLFDEAAEGAISLPEARLLDSVAMCQADAGDIEGAVKNARRGGDLLLAAELALDAGKKQQAADDALHVYAVLPELPKPKPSANGRPRGYSASAVRVGLLKRIAVVLLRAGKEREGRIILSQARKIIAESQGREFDRLTGTLERAQAEAAGYRLADGDIDAARRAAELLKATPGGDVYLPEIYSNIGVALWKDGKKADAATAFATAVAACQALPGTHRSRTGFGGIAAARARVGDVDGAVKTLALRKTGRAADSELGDIAVAQVRAGDPNGALETIASVRSYTFRYTNILRRITDAVAQRGDLEEAFRMFLANARTVGVRIPEPIELAARAVDADKGDLLHRYYRPNTTKSLAMLARKAADAGKADLARAILERGLEHLAGLNDTYSSRGEIIATISLMSEHGDKAKALRVLRDAMTQPEASERKASQSVPITVDLMLRIGSLDDILAWAAKTSRPRQRTVILQTAVDALVSSVLLPQGRLNRLRTPHANAKEPAEPSAVERIFGRLRENRDGRTTPPYIAPGSKRPAVKLVEARLPTGTWTVQRIIADARRNRNSGPSGCEVCVKDGVPMVFFFDADSGQGGWSVIRVHKSGGTWRREEFARPNKKDSYGWLDAAVVAGVPHVALNSNEIGQKRTGSLEIRALRDGKWTTVFEKLRVGSHYGRRVAIGGLSGRVVAVYTDVYPQSGGHSHNAKFLEQGADGKWTEMRLPLPHVSGLTNFDIRQVGEDAALAFSTSGARGKYTGLRAEGNWTFDNVNKLTQGNVFLFALNGAVASLSSGGYDKRKIVFNTSDKSPQPAAALPSGFNPNLVDAATVGARPALICYDRKSKKMFYLKFESSGKWVGGEVTIGRPFRDVERLRLFEIAGKPTAIYFESSRRRSDLYLIQLR